MPRLAPPISAAARQTMKVAFEELERSIDPSDARALRSMSTIAQVREVALGLEKQLAARQALRNMRRLTPLLTGLEHYAKVVDVLCNGTPYLAWIWSPITLVLRIASEYIEAFEQLMKGYSKIADCLGRFEILGDAFIGNPDFQQTLAIFYADILQFHRHAYKFVRRSGWRLLFLTSWGRFQRRFDNILDDLKKHGELIDLEANARNIAEARQMRQEIRSWREESLDLVLQDEEERAAKQYRSIMSWLRIDESEQLSIFEAISEEGNKFPGTCSWIVKHPKICAWLQKKNDTPFVWLQGNPGTGKSVISAQLVKFLNARNSIIVRHFCTYSYVSSTKYEYIIRSLLLQLLHGNAEFVAHVYQDCVVGKKPASMSTLESLLCTIATTLTDNLCETEHIWILLDGLDECEADRQPRLLRILNQITSKSASNGGTVCKVLISSRFSPVLLKYLRKKHSISLSDEIDQLNTAIRKYALQRLQSSTDRFRQLEIEPEDVEDIATAITEKAHGMFLYARLVLDYVTSNIFFTGDEIKQSIQQLPPTLTDFYEKILTQILARLDPRSVDRIQTILSWIAYARRPLKRLELLSAVLFSMGDPNVDRLVPQYVLDICSPLIEERRDTTLAFIHVSVKEFLQSPSSSMMINEHTAVQQHGIATITCLLSGLRIFNEAPAEQRALIRLVKGVHGLHVYATEFWTEYLLLDAEALHGSERSSPLLETACQLAGLLENSGAALPREGTGDADEADERIQLIRQHEVLYRHVRAAIKARSRKTLELELLRSQESGSECASKTFACDGVSRMLQFYQGAVESLLNEEFLPGVSAEELESFKNQFRTSAYTCRLRCCPRATIGFENAQLRREHEIVHAGGFRCTYTDCQYPPFRSSQALKVHVGNCHAPSQARKSIRRVGMISAPLGATIRRSNPCQSEKSRQQALGSHVDGVTVELDPYRLDYRGESKPPPALTSEDFPNTESHAGQLPESHVPLLEGPCICTQKADYRLMVQCKSCTRWVHMGCGGIVKQAFLSDYNCVFCGAKGTLCLTLGISKGQLEPSQLPLISVSPQEIQAFHGKLPLERDMSDEELHQLLIYEKSSKIKGNHTVPPDTLHVQRQTPALQQQQQQQQQGERQGLNNEPRADYRDPTPAQQDSSQSPSAEIDASAYQQRLQQRRLLEEQAFLAVQQRLMEPQPQQQEHNGIAMGFPSNTAGRLQPQQLAGLQGITGQPSLVNLPPHLRAQIAKQQMIQQQQQATNNPQVMAQAHQAQQQQMQQQHIVQTQHAASQQVNHGTPITNQPALSDLLADQRALKNIDQPFDSSTGGINPLWTASDTPTANTSSSVTNVHVSSSDQPWTLLDTPRQDPSFVEPLGNHSTQLPTNSAATVYGQQIQEQQAIVMEKYIPDHVKAILKGHKKLREQRLPPSQQQLLQSAQTFLDAWPSIIGATDQNTFPENIFYPQTRGVMPVWVKTWGELRAWRDANPSSMPGINAHRILLLQVLDFQEQYLRQQHSRSSNRALSSTTGLSQISEHLQIPSKDVAMSSVEGQGLGNQDSFNDSDPTINMDYLRVPVEDRSMPLSLTDTGSPRPEDVIKPAQSLQTVESNESLFQNQQNIVNERQLNQDFDFNALSDQQIEAAQAQDQTQVASRGNSVDNDRNTQSWRPPSGHAPPPRPASSSSNFEEIQFPRTSPLSQMGVLSDKEDRNENEQLKREQLLKPEDVSKLSFLHDEQREDYRTVLEDLWLQVRTFARGSKAYSWSLIQLKDWSSDLIAQERINRLDSRHRPYRCDIPYCVRFDRTFSTYMDLDKHKLHIHYIYPKITRFLCTVKSCREWSGSLSIDPFKEHIRLYHREENVEYLTRRSVYQPEHIVLEEAQHGTEAQSDTVNATGTGDIISGFSTSGTHQNSATELSIQSSDVPEFARETASFSYDGLFEYTPTEYIRSFEYTGPLSASGRLDQSSSRQNSQTTRDESHIGQIQHSGGTSSQSSLSESQLRQFMYWPS